MADPRLFRLRTVFRKQGRLALLSHLEVARALERCVRRAGLPFAVTQGFSPHMRIAFGAALPVGVGGTAEFYDLFLTDYVAPKKALAALQNSTPEDLAPLRCSYAEPKAPAASVAFPFSTYEAVLSDDPGTLAFPETVTVVRKKKEKELAVADYLIGSPKQEGNRLIFTLEAKPSGSLRPDKLMDAVIALNGEQGGHPLAVLSLTRIAQESEAGERLS